MLRAPRRARAMPLHQAQSSNNPGGRPQNGRRGPAGGCGVVHPPATPVAPQWLTEQLGHRGLRGLVYASSSPRLSTPSATPLGRSAASRHATIPRAADRSCGDRTLPPRGVRHQPQGPLDRPDHLRLLPRDWLSRRRPRRQTERDLTNANLRLRVSRKFLMVHTSSSLVSFSSLCTRSSSHFFELSNRQGHRSDLPRRR